MGRGPGEFRGSAPYWEERYAAGGTSGAGSYGRLAHFKAETLNRFVRDHGVRSVVELGSGDGAQLGLAEYPSYVGLDVSETAVRMCVERFAGDETKRFEVIDEAGWAPQRERVRADLSMSLDVIYHLVEDETFERYMERLFDLGERFVVIYSSNEEPPGYLGSPHVRHRTFTDWIEAKRPEWRLIERIPNRYPYDPNDRNETSFADFYFFERPEAPGGG